MNPSAFLRFHFSGKKRMWFSGLILCLLFSGCLPPVSQTPSTPHPTTTPHNDPSVIHLTNGEWQPFSGETLPHYGCDSQIITEAFALQGISVEYGFYPWARAYRLAEEGSWDGTLEWADTPEHREKFFLSENYLSNQEWVFFHRTDQFFDWTDLNDLKGKTIGLTQGYVYSDFFITELNNPAFRFEEASSDEANFRKLLAGRIDLFPVEISVGNTILQQKFTPEERLLLQSHPRAFAEFKPYLLLSKAIPENQDKIILFNLGFQQLHESGRYDEIMNSCLP